MEHSRRQLLTTTGSVIGAGSILAATSGQEAAAKSGTASVIDVQVLNRIRESPAGDWTLNHIEVCPPRPDIQSAQVDSRLSTRTSKDNEVPVRYILAPSFFYRNEDVVVTEVNDANSVRSMVYLETPSPTPRLNFASPEPGVLSIELPEDAALEGLINDGSNVMVPQQGKAEVHLFDREVTVRASQQTDELKDIAGVPEWRCPFKTKDQSFTLPVTTTAVVRRRDSDTVREET
jgi:hypothetical protein